MGSSGLKVVEGSREVEELEERYGSLTRQVRGRDIQVPVSLLGCSGAAFPGTSAVEQHIVEPRRHGWWLSVGQMEQVGYEDGLQQTDHHQGQAQGKIDT